MSGRRIARALALLVVLVGVLVGVLAPTAATARIEDYARYVPESHCSPFAKRGALFLSGWLVRHYGGTAGRIAAPCDKHTVSEHQEGRAVDWMVDVRVRSERRLARSFLDDLFDRDGHDNPDAMARRMGVMYVIWNDKIWSAWDGFRPHPYLNGGCKKLSKCSITLRHRDHVHVSLTRKAGIGDTSWFTRRMD